MAAAERKLTVVLAGEDRSMGRTLAAGEQATGRFGSKLGGLGRTAKIALAGSATAVVAFAASSISAFKDSEVAQTALSDAFAKYPQLAGANADALRALNEERARSTKFDDDATAAAQAQLAQFGLTEDQMLRMTPLLQDYAEKTGKDLTTAATDVGKAMLGQGRAFKSVGLDLKDTGSAAGNFDQLMVGLTDKVGGYAEVAGGTAAGKSEILKNQFGELQEKVGGALMPALLGLTDIILQKVLPTVDRIGSWLGEHKPVLIAFAAVVGTGLVVAFLAWASSAAAAAAATLAATWPVLAILAGLALLAAGIIYAYNHFGFFKAAVDAVAKFLTGVLWPALKAGWDWISNNWQKLLAILTGPIGAAVYIIKTHWDSIKAGATATVDWFKELPGKIASAFSSLASIITSPFRTAFGLIRNLWNDTIGGFGFEFAGWNPPGPGSVPGISFRIPEMHTGGVFQSGSSRGEGLALLKDNEGVFTPEQMAALGRPQALHLYIDGREVAVAVRRHDRGLS